MRPGLFPGVLLALLGAGTAADAFGRDDQWVSGFGQGVAEALVTYGPGNRIYVTCNHDGGPHASSDIDFTLAGMSPTGSHVTLTFDGEDPQQFFIADGKITSDCRVCANNYEYVVSKLKAHSSVHVLFENGDAARFTLKGSSEAIGECVPDFAR